jgi:hypothetical protein
MPLTLTPEMETAIAAREVVRALMVEFQTDGGSRYAWNQPFNITESAVRGSSTTWTGLGERLMLGGPITMAVDLQGETVTLLLDASAINDGADFVGAVVDASWHQRPVIIREVLFANTASFRSVIGALNTWYGLMDRDEFSEGEQGSVWTLSCESGAFQYFRTNQHRRTNANQQRFASGDRGFEYTAAQVMQAVPFGQKANAATSVPTTGGNQGIGRYRNVFNR